MVSLSGWVDHQLLKLMIGWGVYIIFRPRLSRDNAEITKTNDHSLAPGDDNDDNRH